MKNLFIIILFFTGCCFAYSQNDWFWQNPLPQGNPIYALNTIDENNLMCFSSSNILKTTDAGENWNLLSTGFPNNNKSLSMLDLYTGFMLLSPNILIKTANGGYNWNFVNEVDTAKYPSSIKFISPDTGFLFCRNGQFIYHGARIFRTSNGGVSWNIVFEYPDLEIYNVFFPSQSTGYVTGSKYSGSGNIYNLKFFKTTNGGISWDSIPNSINLNSRSLYFIDEYTGFVGGSGISRIYQTTTGGKSWEAMNNNNLFSDITQIQFLNYTTGYVSNGLGYIFKTTNLGLIWTKLNNYPQVVTQFWFADPNIAHGIGNGGLIIKTVNGGVNWRNYSNGTNDVFMEDIRFSDANTGFVTGEGGTILKTVNGGLNWNLIQFPQANELTSISNINSSDWFLASFFYGKIFKTTNTGITWDTLFLNYYGITRIEFINALTGYGVCKYDIFFKTTDGGQTWKINNTFNTGQNWSLDFIDENTGYAGGNRTRKTTNGGTSWDTVSLGGYYSADIQFINYNTGFIASYKNLGSGNYPGLILKTTNAGLSWQSTLLGNYYLLDIYFLNERTGFALNGYEIFKTTNGGDNWFSFRTCSYNPLYSIFFTDSLNGYCTGDNSTIIKTTNGGGAPVGIEPIEAEVPESFFLYQNYPNPFNPKTIISYKTENSNFILLRVYDLLGKEAAILVNEKQSPGKYEVLFDGSNFPSGIYIYTIEAYDGSIFSRKSFLQSRKMVLIK